MSTDKYPYLFSRQIGAIVCIALYGNIKFSKGKHSANLWVHIVVKRCIVTALYGSTVLLRGIILHSAV